MGLDIDLYTPKIDIGDDGADDIIIEITGLKSISKFIGLEDTPLYYDNGKFFKVEDNKIVYADIQWKDISGDISESPEIVAVISDLVNEVASDIIDERINLHNLNTEAHPFIQNIIQENYNTLDTKIDTTKEELSEELNTETSNRETADNALSEDIQEEILARIEGDTTLQNGIDTLNTNLQNEIDARTEGDTSLSSSLDELSNNLIQEVLNRQEQDDILQQQITSNYNTLDDKIDTEISNRTSADTTLQNNINTEASTRQDADVTLQGNIDTLSDTVSNNYTTLDGKITNLTSTVNNNYTELDGRITTNTNNISIINNKIPNQASSSNQLADKDFVNSSIATNTANFIGTFNSVAELEAYTGTLTNNDYAFVATTDAVGNTLYDRYKWNGSEWLFEYELNNSSFTAVQWSAINSGATTENINQITINANDIMGLQTNKQDILTAGENIQINNNIISATDTTYTAGTGISIENGVISNTQTSAEWGNIQGTLSDQTDLQNALDAKYDASNPDNFISGITSSDVTTALGYTPYDASNPNGYINASALNGYATKNWVSNQDYVNSTTLTTTLNNYVLSADLADVATTGDYDDLINKPTEVTESTVSGWGFTKNVGTVTSVNNILPDSNGNVSIPISGTPTWGEITGDITNQTDLQTALGNFVTLNTAQNISGRKTFLGEKAIYFKQSATTNKLGFTLYNPSDTELGAFEYRPNTINGGALLSVNVPYASSNYVGFRYWGTAVNIVAPKVTIAGNYYIPIKFTDGTNTVTSDNTGIVNLTSLLPDLSNYQPLLVSGSNIKTINGASILGNGNLTLDSLPSQIGQSGKFLTTDGTDASWAETTKVTIRDWSVS